MNRNLRMHTSNKTRGGVKKHKGQQMLNDFILYSLTTLACTSFCSSPFWYPPFCATFNVFFFFSLPKITSFLFTSKALFIVGNLIIIFLLGESKFFVSNTTSKKSSYDGSHDDEYECKSLDQLQGGISILKEQKGNKIIKDTPKQDMQLVMILDSKTCEVENDHEEFFELYDDAEDDVDQMAEPSGRQAEDVSCSKGDATVVDHGVEGDGEVSYPPEVLNKLVDDFIARINRQRKLEAEFCRG